VPAIELHGVEKRFGPVTAVGGVTLRVADSEFVSILGPSGCGKTTLLRLVAGFESPTAGTIRVGDRLVNDVRAGVFVPPRERRMGMVFQSYALWPHMTVFENVAYPLRMKRVSAPERHRSVTDVLQTLGLGHMAARHPAELSGGEQQRVALARALVSNPDILLLDEPLSNLDAALREAMRFEIRELQRRFGSTVLYVTHDQAEALAMSDRVAVMRAGELVQVGSPTEIYDHPVNRFVASFVGLVNFLPVLLVDETRLEPDWTGRIRLRGLPAEHAPIECTLPRRPDRPEFVLVVRPEHVRIEPGAQGWPGSVIRTAYGGEREDVWVRIGPHEIRVRRDARDHRIRAGDTVGVRVAHGWFLPPETHRAR